MKTIFVFILLTLSFNSFAKVSTELLEKTLQILEAQEILLEKKVRRLEIKQKNKYTNKNTIKINKIKATLKEYEEAIRETKIKINEPVAVADTTRAIIKNKSQKALRIEDKQNDGGVGINPKQHNNPNTLDISSCATVELTPPHVSYLHSTVGVHVYNNCNRHIYISFAACSNEHIFSIGGGKTYYTSSTTQNANINNRDYEFEVGGGFTFIKDKGYTFHSNISFELIEEDIECPRG